MDTEQPLTQTNGPETKVLAKKKQEFLLCTKRWRLSIMLFLVLAQLYMHRVNLSLAVVCMVDTGSTSPEVTNQTFQQPNIHNASSEFNILINSFGNKQHNLTYNITDETLSEINKPLPVHEENGDECGLEERRETAQKWRPEIYWKKSDVSILLSSYFYGSFFTQIPGGRLADYLGGKHIITVTMALTGVCALLIPICARTHIALMFVNRIIIGINGGAVIPVAVAMLGAWAPPSERPAMLAFTFCGIAVGTTITFLTSGLLCDYGFDGGWPSIFYIQGGLTMLFVCWWCYEAYSTPTQHPRISPSELAFLKESIKHSTSKPSMKTPWLFMALSRPLWATIVAHFAFNWSFFAILINVPLFMKEVMHFDIKQNGLYSALPYIFLMMFMLLCSNFSTFIIDRKYISHILTRKIFTAISLSGSSACLVVAGYLNCELRHIAVVLLCLAAVFQGMSYGGFFANHAEFSGQYVGTTYGITNAGGVIAALLSSLAAGLLTPNGLKEEWQVVFYLAAGINLLGVIMFTFCSSVTLEPWAQGNTQIEMEVFSPDQKT